MCNKNDLNEYRFATGNWVTWNTSNAPAPCAAHSAVVYNHAMYIFAGYDGNSRLNEMWSIQLIATTAAVRTWREIEQFGEQPPTVCTFPLVVVHDALYMFSGQSGAKTSNLLFKFDFKTSTLVQKTNDRHHNLSPQTIYLFINCCLPMQLVHHVVELHIARHEQSSRASIRPPHDRSRQSLVHLRRRARQQLLQRRLFVRLLFFSFFFLFLSLFCTVFFDVVDRFDLDTKTWDLIKINPRSQVSPKCLIRHSRRNVCVDL